MFEETDWYSVEIDRVKSRFPHSFVEAARDLEVGVPRGAWEGLLVGCAKRLVVRPNVQAQGREAGLPA